MANRESINEIIRTRMDVLENLLETKSYIKDPVFCAEILDLIGKYWSAMDEGDREYYEYARSTLDDSWKPNR